MIKPCPYCNEPYEAIRICFHDGEYCAVCMERAMQEALKKHNGYGMINDYFVNKEAHKIYHENRQKKGQKDVK